jgi:hypothetical protein
MFIIESGIKKAHGCEPDFLRRKINIISRYQQLQLTAQF